MTTVEIQLEEAHNKRKELVLRKNGIETKLKDCGISAAAAKKVKENKLSPFDKEQFDQRKTFIEELAAIQVDLKIINAKITSLSDQSTKKHWQKITEEIILFRTPYIQKMDSLIEMRTVLNSIILEGCSRYGNTEFMQLISPLNRILPSLPELMKEKNLIKPATDLMNKNRKQISTQAS